MSFFLVLISVFHGIETFRLKRDDEKTDAKGETAGSSFLPPSIKKIFDNAWVRITSFYLDEKPLSKSEESAETKTSDSPEHSDGLIEIQKDSPSKHSREVAISTKAR
ncbi:MAG: hypothetical protein FWB78_05320, partial [Treponema sp.]|nr:hypothetical protein [Treponema sp.]